MDEFLKIVGMNHIINSGEFESYRPEMIKFMEVLKEYVSDKVYDELEALLSSAISETNDYAFVEGMKVAIAITEKKYIPVI